MELLGAPMLSEIKGNPLPTRCGTIISRLVIVTLARPMVEVP